MNEYVRLELELLRNKSFTPTDKLVYGYLRLRQGGNSYAFPGIETIARDLAIAENTVRDSIRRLEIAGLLAVERNDRGGSGHCHHYLVKNVSAWLTAQNANGAEPEPFTGGEKGAILEPFEDTKGSNPVPKGFNGCTQKGSEFEGEKRDSISCKKRISRIYEAVQFELFWELYPKKGAREQAINAWNAALVHAKEKRPLAHAIIDGLNKWKSSMDWRDPDFVPFAGSFIATRKWEKKPKNFEWP